VGYRDRNGGRDRYDARDAAEPGPSQRDALRGYDDELVGTLTSGGTLAITEVGVFDAAGSGGPPTGANLFLRGDFTAINLVSGDSIAFTVKVQFT